MGWLVDMGRAARGARCDLWCLWGLGCREHHMGMMLAAPVLALVRAVQRVRWPWRHEASHIECTRCGVHVARAATATHAGHAYCSPCGLAAVRAREP